MISPWMVGRTGTLDGLDSFYHNVNIADLADCAAHGIDYQPCVLPGDLSSGHRRHGDFYWRSLYNMIRLGAQGLYVSMFDEFNEGNQIAKTAETEACVPAGSGIRAAGRGRHVLLRPTTTCGSPPTAAGCSRASSR